MSEMAIDGVLQQITDRIVERFRPEGVILFGSRARGTAHAHSDADLLVVMPGDPNRLDAATDIGNAIRDLGLAIDIVVTTRERLRRRGNLVGTVLRPALREGIVLYGPRGLMKRYAVSEAEVQSETRQWLAYTHEDLTVMAWALGQSPPLVNSACFHAQQSIEKALKAVLIWLQVEFAYTHDLEALRALIPPGWAVKDVTGDLDQISRWVTAGRYPDSPPPSIAEAQAAANTARAMVEIVDRELAERGLTAG